MKTQFKISDIFWKNKGAVFPFHHIEGTILLENGYGIHYKQIDTLPEKVTPNDASFSVTILAPADEDDVCFSAGTLTGTRPPFEQNEPLNEILEGGYTIRRCDLKTIADLATQLSELPNPCSLESEDILSKNIDKASPYRVTQCMKRPIDPDTGQAMDLTQPINQPIAELPPTL